MDTRDYHEDKFGRGEGYIQNLVHQIEGRVESRYTWPTHFASLQSAVKVCLLNILSSTDRRHRRNVYGTEAVVDRCGLSSRNYRCIRRSHHGVAEASVRNRQLRFGDRGRHPVALPLKQAAWKC